jgi:hypothetical protein
VPAGRKKKLVPTSHAERLHLLLLEESQTEVARITGLGKQYVSQMYRLHEPDSFGAKGVSAEVIQLLVDRLALDPMFFFDHWRSGEVRSYKEYLTNEPLSAEALVRRVRVLSEQLQEATQKLLAARR